MEYLEGLNLEELVRQDGPQNAGRIIHILEQVSGALAEAHEVGLIHRDIKPANIILCELGGMPDVAKVVDFRLVKPVITGKQRGDRGAHGRQRPHRYTLHGPWVPADLEAVILRCLAKDPAERFATARELTLALQMCVKVTPWSLDTADAWWDAFRARRRQDAHKKQPDDTPAALEIDVDERYASWVPSR